MFKVHDCVVQKNGPYPSREGKVGYITKVWETKSKYVYDVVFLDDKPGDLHWPYREDELEYVH